MKIKPIRYLAYFSVSLFSVLLILSMIAIADKPGSQPLKPEPKDMKEIAKDNFIKIIDTDSNLIEKFIGINKQNIKAKEANKYYAVLDVDGKEMILFNYRK